ncbi:MAG: cellulase family glycosylhydrolase [Anaerolineae bacterium]|nr:cellulase family glycosylhydrolase [Anaerolineae bacterium]
MPGLRPVLTALARLITAVAVGLPAWLPAGAAAEVQGAARTANLFFASDRDGDGDIYLALPDGSVRNLTLNREPDWDPVVSPTGTMVAFVSRRDGNSEIYLLNPAVGNVVNVTNHPAADYEPDWSPDGTRLVFVSERDGGRDLYVLDWRRGAVERLTHSGPGEIYRSPAWAPDGGAIAYSAVRDGVEHVYVLDFASGEAQITQWPLKGRYPAWSPDGERLAFAGWHEDDRPGVYLARRDGAEVRWLWEARGPIRSLTWVGDAVLLSLAEAQGQSIYAVPVRGGAPELVVSTAGWDDCPSVAGEGRIPQVILPSTREPYPKRLAPVLGANIADLSNAHLLHQLGFGWIKNYLSWAGAEPQPNQFYWEDSDNVIEAAESNGLKVLLRLHDTPAWARPPNTTLTHPPSDLEAYGRFVAAVARRYRGRVAAYEIGNEPNLAFEWGEQTPDPAAYAEMLRVAYTAIKAEDPEALVISGGVATTGDGGEGAVGDLDFIRGLYEAGAKGYFDALGSHPYGFGRPPFARHQYGLAVSRLEAQHRVMLEYADGDTPIWATEVGWPLASAWTMGEHDDYVVSEAEQAFYYQQLLLQGAQTWPWLQAVFAFNLDFSTVPWYEAAQPMRWYALLEADGSPRLAFTRLRGVGVPWR